MPPNWWENTKGTPILSNSQYKELIAGKLDENEIRQPGTIADKHIFIDFYMQHCYWCYDFQADWNKIVDEITATYGEENVIFIKVDGQKVYQVSDKYGVQSFPTFIYVEPNTKGLKAIMFQGNRTYQAFKGWITKILKDVPTIDGSVPEDDSVPKVTH